MLIMGAKVSESQHAVRCKKSDVFLNGRWLHKGGGPACLLRILYESAAFLCSSSISADGLRGHRRF